MTTRTEQDPRVLVTASGWCYRITVRDADSSFAYEVEVYLHGHKKADSYTMTKWGARYMARKLRRRHYRRLRLTGETRALQ